MQANFARIACKQASTTTMGGRGADLPVGILSAGPILTAGFNW